MISRLVARWESTPVRERARLAPAVTSLLDIAGSRPGESLGGTVESLGRTVEPLGWRVLEESVAEPPQPSD